LLAAGDSRGEPGDRRDRGESSDDEAVADRNERGETKLAPVPPGPRGEGSGEQSCGECHSAGRARSWLGVGPLGDVSEGARGLVGISQSAPPGMAMRKSALSGLMSGRGTAMRRGEVVS
jgi:hypothetical protein